MSSISIKKNLNQRLCCYDTSFPPKKCLRIKKTVSVQRPFKNNLFKTINFWMQRARQRRQLAGLEKYRWNDMGLTEEMVAKEVSKPFWK
jgi:uncharacterized protein YjiS (DUF1127 family)